MSAEQYDRDRCAECSAPLAVGDVLLCWVCRPEPEHRRLERMGAPRLIPEEML